MAKLFVQLTSNPRTVTLDNLSQVRATINELQRKLDYNTVPITELRPFIARFLAHPDWRVRACLALFLNSLSIEEHSQEIKQHSWQLLGDPDIRVLEFFLTSSLVSETVESLYDRGACTFETPATTRGLRPLTSHEFDLPHLA